MLLIAPRRGDLHQNIASRPRSGDLIVGIAGLAKPVERLLVYSKADASSGSNTAARNAFALLSFSRSFRSARAAFRRLSRCEQGIAMHKGCQRSSYAPHRAKQKAARMPGMHFALRMCHRERRPRVDAALRSAGMSSTIALHAASTIVSVELRTSRFDRAQYPSRLGHFNARQRRMFREVRRSTIAEPSRSMVTQPTRLARASSTRRHDMIALSDARNADRRVIG
ncbi:hypothetical protein ACVW17_000886 [Bradyrhizobium sp. USDA 4473]